MWPLRFVLLLSLIGSSFSLFFNKQQRKSINLIGIKLDHYCLTNQLIKSQEINKSAFDGCQNLLENYRSTSLINFKSKIRTKHQPVYKYSGSLVEKTSDGTEYFTVFSFNSNNGACKPKGVEMFKKAKKVFECLELSGS
ncbi:hypothetical protein GcM3_06104 [Golovinomyces cichoracearum]|uniref:Uncharacterized protein n=1 Tax=Golovinomyces cichoracearum TaxID=62708 RepID=A0A420JB54_9PEZI|nr:hypothetical protein GcM3_06104 [Golovinomyces cichoracearum]